MTNIAGNGSSTNFAIRVGNEDKIFSDYDNVGLDGSEGADGNFNREELIKMLGGLISGADVDNVNDLDPVVLTEAQELADYVFLQADLSENGTLTYGQVMDVLDGDGDETLELEDVQDELQTIRDDRDEIHVSETLELARDWDDGEDTTDNEFKLSSTSGEHFEFIFEENDAYEESLASILDINGGLDAGGLKTMLGDDPTKYAEKLADPMIKATLAMGLMAVGLEENDVVFIMNELISSPTSGDFTVDSLIGIAEENAFKEDEAEEIKGVFAA